MLEGIAKNSDYPLYYHITPEHGLLNDPNGLVQFKGLYHVFYQWNPYGTEHENKVWGHVVSADMVHWERKGIALAPSEYYDKDGIYSGSAVVHDGKLYLFYTGNVVEADGTKHSYQCVATSTDGFHFEKKGPLFSHPEGYTRHVRDPKVWYDDAKEQWYLVLGAQTLANEGTAILYTSADLAEWTFHGELFSADQIAKLSQRGYMWECPDIFQLDNQLLLTYSPQGIEPEGDHYQNIFQSVYLQLSPEEAGFVIEDAEMKELDWGFEFYAPQTFLADDGRRILYGWVGVMESSVERAVPTIAEGWVHHLTIPRELSFKDGVLYQKPVPELEKLRKQKQEFDLNADWSCPLLGSTAEVRLNFEQAESFQFSVGKTIWVEYSGKTRELTLYRRNWTDQGIETRKTHLSQPLKEATLYIDGSSLELFFNHGGSVASARFFEKGPLQLTYLGSNRGEATVYTLEGGRG